MAMERSLIDRFVNGALMGKRQIGRPLKYNLRVKETGWLDLIFTPRNQFEVQVGNFLRFWYPYLAYVTYRFHVEKAREVGCRIEDMYHNKFWKEAYIMHHVFA
jgi:hypothetical protein